MATSSRAIQIKKRKVKRGKKEMNKPCNHCKKAEQNREGPFKCDNPCSQAKQCFENDKMLSRFFENRFLKRR